MNDLMKNLMKEIVFCDNIKKVLIENQESHCSKIIKSQGCCYSNFQLPEPWNGDIVNCKILFISSNPSINPEEEYPTIKWKESEIEDFFLNRFSSKWVNDKLQPLLKNGTYSKKHGQFWAKVRSMAKTLLETENITAGKDYAITEVVHCKSVLEIGVKDALDTCTNKYLDKILKLTKAKILICLGKKAREQVSKKYSISNSIEGSISNFREDKEDKLILFLPHPNQRGEKKKLENILSKDELNLLRNKLKNESCV